MDPGNNRPVTLTMLLQGIQDADQIGYHSAFTSLRDTGRLEGYRSFPYRHVGPRNWRDFLSEVFRHIEESGSDVLFFQYFHGSDLPDLREFVSRVRKLRPAPIIVTSCGDGFGPLLRPLPGSLRYLSSVADVVFSTSMGRLAEVLHRSGAARVVLMPNGACDVRFGGTGSPPPESTRDFDVVFVGSNYAGRNPLRHLYWAARRRKDYVEALAKRYGKRFGLFGHGWPGNPSWQGPVAFNEQVATTQRGLVAFGGYPGSMCDYYTSNRPFMALLSGVPLVDHYVPRVDRLLMPGKEWTLVHDVPSALRAIDRILDLSELERRELGSAGVTGVRERHMDSHRAALMVDFMGAVRAARQSGTSVPPPRLGFFHSGVDEAAEIPTAIIGW